MHHFQLTDEEAFHTLPGAMVTIGRFHFAARAFGLARQTLLKDLPGSFDYLIIDEIGKLELKGEGLEPAAIEVIQHFQEHKTKGKLLLVVRDELVEQVIRHYDISEYLLIGPGQEIPG